MPAAVEAAEAGSRSREAAARRAVAEAAVDPVVVAGDPRRPRWSSEAARRTH